MPVRATDMFVIFLLPLCLACSAIADDPVDVVRRIPLSQRTDRVVTCLSFLQDRSIEEEVRLQLIELFAEDVQYLSPHYGCTTIIIDEDEWANILFEGLPAYQDNEAVVYALTRFLINSGEYDKAVEVIGAYAESHPSSHEPRAWLAYTRAMIGADTNEPEELLEFDVHFCVITANPQAHEKATLSQLREEVAILNRRFVTLDGDPLVKFRFKSASFYDDVKDLGCPFVALGDSTEPYDTWAWENLFNECDHLAVRDPKAINFYIYDAYTEEAGFDAAGCHGKRNSNRPYVLIDWARLGNTSQSPEVHEMGHAFGLGHVGVPGATLLTHTNIMCSNGVSYGSGGRRNLGFTEDQIALIRYHAERTYSRLR